ncbi:hypothetical protein GCM10010837_42900 [Aminobacter niigataensis]
MTDDENKVAVAVRSEPSEAELLAGYARAHWPKLTTGSATPEEIGRALVCAASCGPVNWTGVRILRELGVLIEGSRWMT